MASTMSKLCQKWFKKTIFLSKSSKFRVVWIKRFCSNFTGMWYKYFLRNVWTDFRLPMSVLTTIMTVARKSFNGKFTAKIDFPTGHFMWTLLMLTLEVQSFFIHWGDRGVSAPGGESAYHVFLSHVNVGKVSKWCYRVAYVIANLARTCHKRI